MQMMLRLDIKTSVQLQSLYGMYMSRSRYYAVQEVELWAYQGTAKRSGSREMRLACLKDKPELNANCVMVRDRTQFLEKQTRRYPRYAQTDDHQELFRVMFLSETMNAGD